MHAYTYMMHAHESRLSDAKHGRVDFAIHTRAEGNKKAG